MRLEGNQYEIRAEPSHPKPNTQRAFGSLTEDSRVCIRIARSGTGFEWNMLDHIGIAVTNLQLSKRFYSAALAPLGYALILEFSPEQVGGVGVVGFGVPPKPDFWISGGGGNVPCVHVAFSARNHLLVEAFYRAALSAGGRDNGAPGLRPHYHPHYFGAFVIDLDGHNIEAVCHAPY